MSVIWTEKSNIMTAMTTNMLHASASAGEEANSGKRKYAGNTNVLASRRRSQSCEVVPMTFNDVCKDPNDLNHQMDLGGSDRIQDDNEQSSIHFQ